MGLYETCRRYIYLCGTFRYSIASLRESDERAWKLQGSAWMIEELPLHTRKFSLLALHPRKYMEVFNFRRSTWKLP